MAVRNINTHRLFLIIGLHEDSRVESGGIRVWIIEGLGCFIPAIGPTRSAPRTASHLTMDLAERHEAFVQVGSADDE